MASESNTISGFLNALAPYATPFVNSFAYGTGRSSQSDLDAETLRNYRLNGSAGPSDPSLRRSSGFLDMFFGGPTSSAGTTAGAVQSGFSVANVVLFAVIAAAAVWAFKKFWK